MIAAPYGRFPGRGQDLNSAIVDEYVNSVEPPISFFRSPPGTQSFNLAERGQKKLLMLRNLNLHYGRLSLMGWEDMLFAANGQLDHHPMPRALAPAQRTVSRHEAYFDRRPDASSWIARPGQGAHFMIPGLKMTSGHHMSDAGNAVRPCSKSRGWVTRSLSSRKLVISRNVLVARDPNTRHAQLALSDDLVCRHGSLDTSPDAYRGRARTLFASHLPELLSAPLIVGIPLTGVPIALVPALDAGGDRVIGFRVRFPSHGRPR